MTTRTLWTTNVFGQPRHEVVEVKSYRRDPDGTRLALVQLASGGRFVVPVDHLKAVA